MAIGLSNLISGGSGGGVAASSGPSSADNSGGVSLGGINFGTKISPVTVGIVAVTLVISLIVITRK